MSQDPVAMDAKVFFEMAVRERMLTASCVDDLVEQIAEAEQAPPDFCVEGGWLTPIQAEALKGLLNPESIADGYEVVGLLGHGGIGIVYRARQPNLDRVVALKTISTARLASLQSGSGSSTIARFKQEAVAIAKLKHPNIVTAYDYGASGDRLYLAMEMVDGVDLDSYVKKLGKVDEGTAWRLAKQVAAALAHAYEFDIIHRDIKPANLLLTDPPAGYPLPAGVPLLKVTDFGLARLNSSNNEEEATRLTVAGATMGTPHYMAPEQIDNSSVSFLVDIYALGATVYHMLTGKPPMAGKSLMQIFAEKLAGDTGSIENLPDEISLASRKLLAAMLSPKRLERPQSYDELLMRISDLLEDETYDTAVATATPLPSLLSSQTFRDISNDITQESHSLQAFRRRSNLLKISGVVVALISATLWFFYVNQSPAPPPRQYVATDNLSQLFNGTSLLKWKGRDIALARDRTGFLMISDTAERSLADALRQLGVTDHFGIEFSVDLQDANSLEVWFDATNEVESLSLRIERDQATLGVHNTQTGKFTALTSPTPVSPTSATPVFRIERGAKHWFALQTNPAPKLLGWAPFSDETPTSVQFKASGGDVYLGDVALVSLAPVAEQPVSQSPASQSISVFTAFSEPALLFTKNSLTIANRRD